MANVSDQLSVLLPPPHLTLLRRASKFAETRDVPLYLVGGAVRDLLLGATPTNLDLVVVQPPRRFENDLAQVLGGSVAARSEFLTYRLVSDLLADGEEVDLATARCETYAGAGTLPVVQPSNLDDDLKRRDFTVNAMAIGLRPGDWGELFDNAGGREDLARRVLRVFHDRSFVDDATRILRAVRYMVRLGFRLDTDTEDLLRRDLGHLDDISPDRVRNEMDRMLKEPRAPSVLAAAHQAGVLAAVHPALRYPPVRRLEVPAGAASEDVALATLLYGSDADGLAGIGARVNADARWTRALKEVAAIRSMETRLAGNLRRSELYRLLREFSPSFLAGCSVATASLQAARSLDLYLEELRNASTALTGTDLIALGVAEGPLIGKLLDGLLDARLEGLVSSKEEEEAFVNRSLVQSNPS